MRRKSNGFFICIEGKHRVLRFFSLHQKESVCVEASIMQWSAINSTFWPAQQTKGQEVLFFLFVEYCFLNSGRGRQLRKQGQWISFRLLGGAWGLKDETGGRMGEVNASTLLSNRHGSLLTWLPCYWPFGRWYPLRLVDGGRVLWYEESGEKKEEEDGQFCSLFFLFTALMMRWMGLLRAWGVCGWQLVVRVGVDYLSFYLMPDVVTRIEQLKHVRLKGTHSTWFFWAEDSSVCVYNNWI